MSKFIKNLSLFLAGVPLLVVKTGHGTVLKDEVAPQPLLEPGPVPLRPLNADIDNLFAGHRSHSSHRSHTSHYSGSGGGYYYTPPPPAPAPKPYYPALPPAPTPAPAFAPSVSPLPTGKKSTTNSAANKLIDPASTSAGLEPEQVSLTDNEKLRLQIMRVQIKLKSLGLYEGAINGVRDDPTVLALQHFQVLKGLPEDGLMSTATINALGIPAAR